MTLCSLSSPSILLSYCLCVRPGTTCDISLIPIRVRCRVSWPGIAVDVISQANVRCRIPRNTVIQDQDQSGQRGEGIHNGCTRSRHVLTRPLRWDLLGPMPASSEASIAHVGRTMHPSMPPACSYPHVPRGFPLPQPMHVHKYGTDGTLAVQCIDLCFYCLLSLWLSLSLEKSR